MVFWHTLFKSRGLPNVYSQGSLSYHSAINCDTDNHQSILSRQHESLLQFAVNTLSRKQSSSSAASLRPLREGIQRDKRAACLRTPQLRPWSGVMYYRHLHTKTTQLRSRLEDRSKQSKSKASFSERPLQGALQ